MHLSFLTASFRNFYVSQFLCGLIHCFCSSSMAVSGAGVLHHIHQWLLLQMLSLASVTLRLLFSPRDELKQTRHIGGAG